MLLRKGVSVEEDLRYYWGYTLYNEKSKSVWKSGNREASLL